MHRIDAAGFAAGNLFTDGNPATGTPATVVDAAFLNDVQENLVAVILAAGIALVKGDYNQLLNAIKALQQINASSYAVDNGGANVYQVVYSPAITALTDGMVLKFKAKTANTGASTFNPNGLGAQPIWGANHAALAGGEIVANSGVWVQWNASLNSGNGAWVLVDSTGGALPVAPSTQPSHAVNLGQFVATLAASGSVKIPVSVSGVQRNLIINWGQAVNVASGSHTAITFATAFPNACLRTFATLHAVVDSTASYTVGGDAGTLTGMNVYALAGSTATINWLAIGW